MSEHGSGSLARSEPHKTGRVPRGQLGLGVHQHGPAFQGSQEVRPWEYSIESEKKKKHHRSP